jgi:hypothetical protein
VELAGIFSLTVEYAYGHMWRWDHTLEYVDGIAELKLNDSCNL